MLSQTNTHTCTGTLTFTQVFIHSYNQSTLPPPPKNTTIDCFVECSHLFFLFMVDLQSLPEYLVEFCFGGLTVWTTQQKIETTRSLILPLHADMELEG